MRKVGIKHRAAPLTASISKPYYHADRYCSVFYQTCHYFSGIISESQVQNKKKLINSGLFYPKKQGDEI
jgi:hypothetical protein